MIDRDTIRRAIESAIEETEVRSERDLAGLHHLMTSTRMLDNATDAVWSLVGEAAQARESVRRGMEYLERGVAAEAAQGAWDHAHDPSVPAEDRAAMMAGAVEALQQRYIDPLEAGEDYRCPECHATNPRAHKMECTVGRKDA